jgi:hypothetical protein
MLLNQPFNEEISSLEKEKSSGIPLVAKQSSIANVWIDIIGMVLFVAGSWLVWRWVMPFIWPAGPKVILNPSLWTFFGVSILVRGLWNVIFLCPKTN